jgi:hypothetical protein
MAAAAAQDEVRPRTRERALEVNIASPGHGTFAVISAGQEVVRRFFQGGHAAATAANRQEPFAHAVDAFVPKLPRPE